MPILTEILAGQEPIWNTGEFLHGILGTYDLAQFLIGMIGNCGGLLLSMLGKVTLTGENKDPSTPTPDPTALTFVFTNKKSRALGSLIVIFLIMRIFAWQLANITYLIIFSFSVGFFWYLMADWLINFLGSRLQNLLPGFKKP